MKLLMLSLSSCHVKIGIQRTNSVGRIFDSGLNVNENLPNSEEALLRGEYAVIRSLIRVLEVVNNSSSWFFTSLLVFIYFVTAFIVLGST
jgi:hypothetical protein